MQGLCVKTANKKIQAEGRICAYPDINTHFVYVTRVYTLFFLEIVAFYAFESNLVSARTNPSVQ